MADRSFSCAWVHRIQNCQNSKSQGTRYQGNLPNESSCWRIAVHAPNVECTVALIMSWHVRLCTRLSLLFHTASGGKLGKGLGTRLPLVKKKKHGAVCMCSRTRVTIRSDLYIFYTFIFSSRRGTYASGSGLRPAGRRGSSRIQSGTGTGTGGGHSGHSANSGDSLADDDDDI